jgi:hypothetical protein
MDQLVEVVQTFRIGSGRSVGSLGAIDSYPKYIRVLSGGVVQGPDGPEEYSGVGISSEQQFALNEATTFNRWELPSSLCEPCSEDIACASARCDRGRSTQNTERCIPNDGWGVLDDCCNHDNQCQGGLRCTTPGPGEFGVCVN